MSKIATGFDGQVILLGFRPQWRGQSFGTFRILFNALLVGNIEADAQGTGVVAAR
ncbi:MAG TPA: hypothetical protein QGG47_08900 [Acidobacteriota bacterium]|nr:hypothetical protein [Acidobacteriota bacterium]